jgi:hypothetical protein
MNPDIKNGIQNDFEPGLKLNMHDSLGSLKDFAMPQRMTRQNSLSMESQKNGD